MTKVQSKKHKERKEAVVEMTEQEFKQFGDSLIEKYSENDACPIDKPCEKSTIEHDLDALNEQAKKQYEEYLSADKWTCPQCGRKYHWQKNDEGRYAFCPKCQLASKEGKA
jgi:rubrerythrin